MKLTTVQRCKTQLPMLNGDAVRMTQATMPVTISRAENVVIDDAANAITSTLVCQLI